MQSVLYLLHYSYRNKGWPMSQYFNVFSAWAAWVPQSAPRATKLAARSWHGWQQWLLRFAAVVGLWACMGAAQAQQDLIVVRSVPVSTGTTGSIITYDIAYKNGGPGAADGANLLEQLPNGFVVLDLNCVGAFGGAVCPTNSLQNNDLNSFPFPRIEGSISTFPEFAVVRLRVIKSWWCRLTACVTSSTLIPWIAL